MTKAPRVTTTRLLIQGVVVVESLLLITCGAWWGLCQHHDELCVPIQAQGGRPILAGALISDDLFAASTTKSDPKRQRLQCTVTLYLEDGSNWSEWTDALNVWMKESAFSKWPLWKQPPETKVVVGGLLKYRPIRDEEKNHFVVRHNAVQHLIAQRSPIRDDKIEITLFIPKKAPLLILNTGGTYSSAVSIDHNQLITIIQNLTAFDESITASMLFLRPFLKEHHDVGSSNEEIMQWLHEVATSYLARAGKEVFTVRDSLLESKSDVAVTNAVAKRWFHALKSIDKGLYRFHAEQWRESVQHMEVGLKELESIHTDPSLMPPLNFQIDHGLAIFAPLLFPLLLPILAGLFREYKRYRMLKND